jgi:hypothetical protein
MIGIEPFLAAACRPLGLAERVPQYTAVGDQDCDLHTLSKAD